MAFDVMSVFVKIGADTSGLEDGLSKTKGMVAGLGNVVGAGMAVAGAAVAGATAAVGALGKAALSSYSNYEQLVGGVDKLYGTASNKLQEYAENAYLTAGMSANSYMETATSFSAALINSLEGDVDKAADMTDMAMRAISDNVNVFGSDFGSVQNAFQGFAKQNYTMLDNLKLGYGGTKQEMERLIEDANEYRESIGQSADLSIDSFADVVQAIQSVQEAQHIAGTTNAEAMKTIEGSANATKAAWQNVITAIGRGEGLSEALNGLTTALFGAKQGEGLLNQVIPRIKTIMEGIGEFVSTAAPYITDKLPALVSSILPSMISSGLQLLEALGQGILNSLPTILKTASYIMDKLGEGIISAIPSLLNGAKQIIAVLGTYLVENAPNILTAITEVIRQIAVMLTENAQQIVQGAIALLTGLAQAFIENVSILLPAILQLAVAIAVALVEQLPTLVKAVIDIAVALVQAIIDYTPKFWDACLQILVAIVNLIVEYGGKLLNAMGDALTNLVARVGAGMSDMYNTFILWLSQLPSKMAYYAGYAIGEFIKFVIQLPSKVNEIFNNVMSRVASFGTNFANKARETATNFFNNLVNGIASLPSRVASLGQQIVSAVSDLPSKFADIGKNIVDGLWNGIKGGWDWLTDKVSDLANSLLQGAKDALGIESPSKEFAYVGRMVDEGFAKGLTNYSHLIDDAIDDVIRVPDVNSILGASLTAQPNNNAGYTQILNISSPEALTPYEIARQTRNATRDMVLAMSM